MEIGRFSCKGYDIFGPFKLIGGLAKGHPDDKDLEMRLVSNNLCFGSLPEPEDEVEKNFNIDSTRAAYLLGNVGFYFSEYQELIFVTDIGAWTIELTNTNDEVCVVAENVDVVTKDAAPFPINQCKKVIEVIPEERILG